MDQEYSEALTKVMVNGGWETLSPEMQADLLERRWVALDTSGRPVVTDAGTNAMPMTHDYWDALWEVMVDGGFETLTPEMQADLLARKWVVAEGGGKHNVTEAGSDAMAAHERS